MGSKQSLLIEMGMGADELASRKAFVGFTDEDASLLKSLAPLIAQHADNIVDGFYDNVARYQMLKDIISSSGSTIERLKGTQKKYLLELFGGEYGEGYFERRLNIGVVHNKIGLTPQWYLGSYGVYLQLIVPLVMKRCMFRPKLAEKMIMAINKIISIDSQLAIETYIYAVMKDLKSVSMSKSDLEEKVACYQTMVGQIAIGDLTQKIDIEGDDDLSQLGGNLNAMTENLRQMASQVSQASYSLSSSMHQVQESVSSQSAGAAEQAASIAETVSTLEEIRATTTQTMEKAVEMGDMATQTTAAGEQGAKMLGYTIKGMHSIREKMGAIATTILDLSDKTQQIGDIISSVNNLTQQTKMLSLNASIEAAKAGDAGKGFSVVATEIRDLSDQSQQATSQISKILTTIRSGAEKAVMATEDGQKEVDQGVSLVDQSGDKLNALLDLIRNTAMSSQQIVAAVRQGSSGIDQIAIAMADINKATEQFVASTEQSSSVVNDLNQLAVELREHAGAYKV
ncbi:MAG: protoglobin domain-containing protein [Mariprofundus sp.]|nr:protoglobin domain-containing protein [Mariprofundus sp.]